MANLQELTDLQAIICKEYPRLSVRLDVTKTFRNNLTETSEQLPFLHIYKPAPSKDGYGLTFLPNFHVIVTHENKAEERTGETHNVKTEVSEEPTFIAQLITFHGKVTQQVKFVLPVKNPMDPWIQTKFLWQ